MKHPHEDRTKSGQHPAVKSFRAKLDSISEHQERDLEALEAKVGEAVERCKSSCPPAAPAEGAEP